MKKSDILGAWKVYDIVHTGERSMYMGSYTLTIKDDNTYSESSMGYPLSLGDWKLNTKDSIITLTPNDSYLKKDLHPLLQKMQFVLNYEKVWKLDVTDNKMEATRMNTSDCDEYNHVEKMIMLK